MGVYIDMEMPTRCAECRLSTVHSFNDRPLCDVLVEYMSYGEWETKRLDNCPLIEVPEPHGRLYDLYDIFDNMQHSRGIDINCSSPGMTADLFQGYAPVIPASKEG